MRMLLNDVRFVTWLGRAVRRFGGLALAISFLLVAASCLDREVACLEPTVESGVAVEISQNSADVIDLVFLIDTSGSMAPPDRLPLLINSFKLMLDSLSPEDTV